MATKYFFENISAPDRLAAEIATAGIVTSLDHIDVSSEGTDVWFVSDLSLEEQLLLVTIFYNHINYLSIQGSKVDNSFSDGANTRPTVGSISSEILAANANRKYAIITNQGGATIFLKLGAAAVVGQGIPLPDKASYEITSINLWAGPVSAIKNGGNINIEVFEGE